MATPLVDSQSTACLLHAPARQKTPPAIVHTECARIITFTTACKHPGHPAVDMRFCIRSSNRSSLCNASIVKGRRCRGGSSRRAPAPCRALAIAALARAARLCRLGCVLPLCEASESDSDRDRPDAESKLLLEPLACPPLTPRTRVAPPAAAEALLLPLESLPPLWLPLPALPLLVDCAPAPPATREARKPAINPGSIRDKRPVLGPAAASSFSDAESAESSSFLRRRRGKCTADSS